MSRSYKKYPGYFPNGTAMKQWKKRNNKTLRGEEDEEKWPANFGYYKKINDIWGSPSDGKHYDFRPKGYRK